MSLRPNSLGADSVTVSLQKIKNFTVDPKSLNLYNNILTTHGNHTMKLIEFTYTKSDGSQSERAVIELQQPCKYVEGIDVSQMPEQDFADFCREFSLLKTAQHDETMRLLEQFDLKHNYRRFIPEQMQSVKADYV